MGKRILALGLNPAWQKSLFFEELHFGEVNRAGEAHAMASGKGINFIRALHTWGGTEAVVVQPLGGDTGHLIRDSLHEEGLAALSVPVEAATRTCTTLLCEKSATATEIIEPSGELFREEVELLKQTIGAELDRSDALALCGTYPPGITPDFYAWAASLAKHAGKPVILDAYKGIHPALEAGIDFLKINRAELTALTGSADIIESLLSLRRKESPAVLAVTDGGEDAFLADANGIWMFSIPPVEPFSNPIGAGDTCTAVLFAEVLHGKSPREAFAWGLAAASASCMTSYPAVFSRSDAERIRKSISVKQIL